MADELQVCMSKVDNDNIYMRMVEENLTNRILVINDIIDDNILEDCIVYILKWNEEDNGKGIPYKKRTPIKIYINSPGGDIFAGTMLMDVIVASKTPVIGVAFGSVCSMAYHIYLACHQRIAFKNSMFCQHEGDVAVANSASKAKDTMEFFDQVDERLKQHIIDATTMTEEFVEQKTKNEYYMYAQEAKKNGVVHKIIGEDCSINYIL